MKGSSAVGLEKLVLFDIDGTLLKSQGIGRRSIGKALLSTYGTAGSIRTCDVGGRSYLQIAEDALAGTGIPKEQILEKWDFFNEEVTKILGAILQHEDGWIAPLPGGISLVDRLSHNPVVIVGLITGNPIGPSWIKLEAAGYKRESFKVNVFGDEVATRAGLVTLARQRASSNYGYSFPEEHTVIIGDTVNDVDCARQSKARSIIVLSDYDPEEKIRASQPDFIFKDLTDAVSIEKAIFSETDGYKDHPNSTINPEA
jgi:phosphoglycolate phosphatase-like HAD superfamily hydrolase